MNDLITNQNSEIVSKLVLEGDLSKMSPDQKVQYYNSFCDSLGINPLTQPFQLITFQGKQRLYATKDCTEQLRKIHGVSITEVVASEVRGVYVVTAKAKDKEGKTDAATGAVYIDHLGGDALANALMKAETKAKRRVTLSICGLGILDESETDTMPGARTEDIKHEEVKADEAIKFKEEIDRKVKEEKPPVSVLSNGKPLISEKQFKQLMDRVTSGETEVFHKAIVKYRFEEKQMNALNERFASINNKLKTA